VVRHVTHECAMSHVDESWNTYDGGGESIRRGGYDGEGAGPCEVVTRSCYLAEGVGRGM